MNNEFEWRSQMKKLGERIEPTNDLWPGIAARIAQEQARPAATQRRWTRAVAAIAATFVIATGASLIALRSERTPSPALPQTSTSPSIAATQGDGAPTAFDWAQPSDPKLAAAARDLDRAGADLQAALDARPDAVFLVSMINRTNAQRMRLMRQSAISG